MVFGVMDSVDDDDGGGGKAKATAAISCSICLEVVTDNGDRSWAKLQCGHQFHLNCIGSAFNVKGTMQCPNCRKIENGQWLYGNGSRPLSELNMDDWAHDEDLHDIGYSEMSFGVHWCPFSALTGFASSFDEGEFSPIAYHDLLGHHATVSSTSHPCPYIYVGEIRPSYSASTPSVSDGSGFNNHWSGPAVASEVPHSHGFPSADVHYHNWDHSSPFAANSRIPGSYQPSFPSMSQRTVRNSSDMPVAGMHPHILSHSSVSRAPSSTSSAVPPFPGIVTRPHDHAPSREAYLQQSTNIEATHTPPNNSGRRSSLHRGVTQVAPVTSSSDQSGEFYYFSSSNSPPGRTYQEAEVPVREHWFHSWEQEQQHPTFSMSQTDRDPIWGTFHPPAGGSDTGIRSSGSRRRHGSGRSPSQYRS